MRCDAYAETESGRLVWKCRQLGVLLPPSLTSLLPANEIVDFINAFNPSREVSARSLNNLSSMGCALRPRPQTGLGAALAVVCADVATLASTFGMSAATTPSAASAQLK